MDRQAIEEQLKRQGGTIKELSPITKFLFVILYGCFIDIVRRTRIYCGDQRGIHNTVSFRSRF